MIINLGHHRRNIRPAAVTGTLREARGVGLPRVPVAEVREKDDLRARKWPKRARNGKGWPVNAGHDGNRIKSAITAIGSSRP